MGFWADMLENGKSHYSTTKVMRFGCYTLGCCFSVGWLVGSFMGKNIDFAPTVLSWSIALGADVVQAGKSYFDRKTQDSNGAALAVPGTTEPPAANVEIMPQTEPDEPEIQSQAL